MNKTRKRLIYWAIGGLDWLELKVFEWRWGLYRLLQKGQRVWTQEDLEAAQNTVIAAMRETIEKVRHDESPHNYYKNIPNKGGIL